MVTFVARFFYLILFLCLTPGEVAAAGGGGAEEGPGALRQIFHIYKFGFNQDYYTFALILLTKIVVCSQFH